MTINTQTVKSITAKSEKNRDATQTHSDIDTTHNDLSKRIAQRADTFWADVAYTEAPPVPKEMLVEVANICNHACSFCAYSKMSRQKGILDFDLYKDLIRQAYDLGVREIGLYSGAEPLTVKRIADYVVAAKEVGYTYVYITTNGSLANEGRLKKLVDAGLDSLKFSINGGDRETYLNVHGADDFEKVISNLKFVSNYRKESGRRMYLAASFVECDQNRGAFDKLKEIVGPYVDEVFFTIAYNQAGQMDMQPPHVFKSVCAVPFARLNISQEGYLRLCCNDYQNFLAAEDLRRMTLKDAWHSTLMREMRNRHLSGNLDETLCHNCMKGTRDLIKPINPALSNLPQI